MIGHGDSRGDMQRKITAELFLLRFGSAVRFYRRFIFRGA